MSSLKELISLTKQHLLDEYSLKEWKFCDEETYRFFKERAKPQAASPQKAPVVIREIAPVPFKLEAVRKEIAAVKIAEPPPPAEIVAPQQTETDFSDIKKILQSRFPSLAILPTPPDDSEANKASENKSGSEVIILSFDKQTPLFLKNLACAITQEIAPCTILPASRLENEKAWENLLRQKQLKLLLSTDYGLFSLPNAMQYYREVPKQAKSFLGNIPLLLLTDLSLYLKEPKLKPTLWRAICQMIK